MGLLDHFKRRQIDNGPYAPFLAMAELELVQAVRSLIQETDPNGCLMIAVAFNQIDVILKWMIEMARKAPKKALPTDIDGFIIFNSRALLEAKEEIEVRRLHWFAMAALVKKATDICINNKYDNDAAFIWIRLGASGAIAEDALRHNIVWSDQEKSYFSHVHTEKSGISYILNHVMPASLRKNRLLNKFFNDQNIFLSL